MKKGLLLNSPFVLENFIKQLTLYYGKFSN